MSLSHLIIIIIMCEMCWCGVNFPRCGVNFPRDLKYQIQFCFFPLKKSEQPEIVTFNRIIVNCNIHFVDSCNTGQKNI